MKGSQRKQRHKKRKPRTFSGSKKRLHHKLERLVEEKDDIKRKLSTQIKAMKMSNLKVSVKAKSSLKLSALVDADTTCGCSSAVRPSPNVSNIGMNTHGLHTSIRKYSKSELCINNQCLLGSGVFAKCFLGHVGPIRSSRPEISVPQWKVIAAGIAFGLNYLHEKCGILHNDLKEDNIVLQQEIDKINSVIIDFGKACMIENGKRYSLSKENKEIYKSRHPHI
uniref:Protein kinase domain-containing protein n=1 Tax=Amphimedon queenslandica TaxID=400682 RepID=A0A1X7TUD5_AMPQE